MNLATTNNGWTVEAIISTTSTAEQYIFDPRPNVDDAGMAFGINAGKPTTWARGSVAHQGNGANPRPATSGPTIEQHTWNHIAWAKIPSDNTNM
jgi:hypothetical protein